MRVVLDTNHFRELVENGPLGRGLLARIDQQRAAVCTCLVVAEESLRGWFARLNRERPGQDQLAAYFEPKRCLEALTHCDSLGFEEEAADGFMDLRKQLPRLGTMELKIAALCLTQAATLLSRNLTDFQQVPGLRCENWLD